MLLKPHLHFDLIKKHSIQYYHKRTKNNTIVYYEKPGSMNLKELKKYNIGEAELLYHFIYITEYLWCKMDATPLARVMSILDLNGIGMSDFTGPVMDMVRKVSDITKQHYPERSYQIVIINAPWAFQAIFKVIKQFMDPNTVAKTHVIGKKPKEIFKILNKFIDINDIPQEYGGQSMLTNYQNSPDEQIMRQYVHSINKSKL